MFCCIFHLLLRRATLSQHVPPKPLRDNGYLNVFSVYHKVSFENTGPRILRLDKPGLKRTSYMVSKYFFSNCVEFNLSGLQRWPTIYFHEAKAFVSSGYD